MPVAAGLYYFAHHSHPGHRFSIVLLHGAGGSHLSWPPEIRRVVGYDIYAVDLPGHGKSDAHGEQTIMAYADQVLAWMQALNLYRVFLVGHSMGGAIAMSVAAAAPTRVAGLGLLGIGTPLEVPPDILENLSNPAMVPSALNKIKALSFSPDPNPRLVQLFVKRLAETRTSVLRGDFLACTRFDLASTFAQIKPPVLAIAGAQDQMVPLRYVQLLTKKIKNTELVVIPDAGHMLMLEKPDEVAVSLKTFFERQEFMGL